ncbi:MAG: ATP-binding protein, partial [Deltaproteobacteria bacterium]
IQITTFLLPFTTGLLLTCGLIIMVSQRLLGESIENKERFEHIFNTSPDAMLIMRMADGQYKYVDCNESVTALSGFSRAEIIGKSGRELATWKEPENLQQVFAALKKEGFCDNLEEVFLRKDGSILIGMLSARIITLHGEPHIISVIHDITARKRAEQALQEAHDHLEVRVEERTQELHESLVHAEELAVRAEELTIEAEAASRAKSLFIGNMSHELRTPLSGVLGMTEALLTTPVTEQQRGYAETIRKSGKALLVVVGNILDFSKISAGNMALDSSPFLVESVIANVVNLFGPTAAEEKIGLHTVIDPELPAVLGDTPRLTQVVNNLVGNAVKFTKAGEIRVAVKILRKTEVEVDLAISVQDTGIGMTEEELSRIFTPFTQGDTTTGRRFGGTGLGLTISRNLIELMGGTLQVESIFGKGSLFTVLVTFPIAQGFARSDFKSVPINPVTPAIPVRPELPPGDMAELHALLEQLKGPLDSAEPMPCKKIMATLLEKSWPEEQEILLAELNRLIKHYRLQEAFDLLNKGAG